MLPGGERYLGSVDVTGYAGYRLP